MDHAVAALLDAVDELRGRLARVEAELRRRRGNSVELEDGTMRRPEAAKFLGYTEATMKRMAVRREGPPYHMVRGRTYYRVADLEAWRAQNLRPIALDKPKKSADLPLFQPIA